MYAEKKEKARLQKLDEEQRRLQEREEQIKAQEEELRRREEELNKQMQAVSEANDQLPEKEQVDLRSKGARSQALKRLKKALPKKRAQEVTTRADLNIGASPAGDGSVSRSS